MPTHEQKLAIFSVGETTHATAPPQAPYVKPPLPDGWREDPRNHWCESPNCRAWGLFGFGQAGVVGGPMRWFCGKHRNDGD